MIIGPVKGSVRGSIRDLAGSVYNPLIENLVLDAPLTQSLAATVGTSPTLARTSVKQQFFPVGEGSSADTFTEIAANAGSFEPAGLSIERSAVNHVDLAGLGFTGANFYRDFEHLKADAATAYMSFTFATIGTGKSVAVALRKSAYQANTKGGVQLIQLPSTVLASAHISDLDDEWQIVRCESATAGDELRIYIGDYGSANVDDEMQVYFPSCYDQAWSGSVLATDSAPFTRQGDKLTVTGVPAPNAAHTIAFDLVMDNMDAAASIFVALSETPQRSLRVDPDGSITCKYGTPQVASSAGLFAENVGKRVVMTSNGTTFSLYVNGALIGTDTMGAGSTGGNLVFGQSNNAWFHMSNLKIYNAVATATQVPYL